MPRLARVVVPGLPHHITHRGNQGQRIFFDSGDHEAYLATLRDSARKHGMDVWCYCLMPNHVHLIAVPGDATSFAGAIGRAHKLHAARIHIRRSVRGHLWSQRFFSTPLGEAHLWAAARYVERNPVRAGLVRRAIEYPWSSASAHALRRNDPILSGKRPFPGGIDWMRFLDEAPGGDDERLDRELRESTRSGRPCGTSAFMQMIEERIRRGIAARPRGRPPAHSAKAGADSPGLFDG